MVTLFFIFAHSLSAWAASAPLSYYGRDFAANHATLRGSALRSALHTILDSAHSPASDGFDVISASCGNGACYRHTEVGYGEARKLIFGDLFLVKEPNGEFAVPDLYCDRLLDADDLGGKAPGPGRLPDHRFVNVEHTWPQSGFSRRYKKELQKSDLHHLFPTDSEMNSRRSSYGFGEVVVSDGPLKCAASMLGASRGGEKVFQPPLSHRGNVARALYYFALRYEMKIDAEEEAALRKWSREDPVDEEEIARNEKIFGLQKSRNPFVDLPELADQIQDF